MKKTFFMSIIAISALMVSCCNKPAQPSEEKESVTATTRPGIAAFRTGMALATYGYEVKSASALIEAASILASVPTEELKAEVEKGNYGNANETEKVDKGVITSEKLLADARELAGDDAILLEMANRVTTQMSQSLRGAGERSFVGTVDAQDYIYIPITFRGGEIGEIYFCGDHDTDLDLYVYDNNGNLIVSETSYSDEGYVSFYVYLTSTFRVKIVNRGGVYNDFILLTN